MDKKVARILYASGLSALARAYREVSDRIDRVDTENVDLGKISFDEANYLDIATATVELARRTDMLTTKAKQSLNRSACRLLDKLAGVPESKAELQFDPEFELSSNIRHQVLALAV